MDESFPFLTHFNIGLFATRRAIAGSYSDLSESRFLCPSIPLTRCFTCGEEKRGSMFAGPLLHAIPFLEKLANYLSAKSNPTTLPFGPPEPTPMYFVFIVVGFLVSVPLLWMWVESHIED